MNFLRSLAVALLAGVFLASTTRAQCVAIGPGCAVSGMNLACGAPRIGTNWVIGEQNAGACGGSVATSVPILTVFGTCQVPGIALNPPLACIRCGGCELNVLPIDFMLQWTWPPRTTIVPIPNNRFLVGYQFCIQNACLDPINFCFCVSGAWQVTIQA